MAIFVARGWQVLLASIAMHGYGSAEPSLVWGEDMPVFVSDLVASDIAEPSG